MKLSRTKLSATRGRRLTASLVTVAAMLSTVQGFQSISGNSGRISVPSTASSQFRDSDSAAVPRSQRPLHHASFHQRSSATQRNAIPIISSIADAASSPLGAASVLAIIVTIHELGHYLAARVFGITVEEFSVGFGPKLISFNKFGNEFNLRALPLGGYVRFPENYDMKEAQQLENRAVEAYQERRRTNPPSFTQEVLNFVTFGEADRRQRQQQREQEQLEIEQEMAQQTFLQRILNRGPKQVPQEQDPEDFEIDYYDDPDLLQNRPWFERAVVLSGGVIMNLVLAFALYFGQVSVGPGVPQPVFQNGVVVTSIAQRDSASKGILNVGDVIVGVGGSPVTMSGNNAMGAQKEVSSVISTIRAVPEGDQLKLNVLRGQNKQNVDVYVQPKRVANDVGQKGPQSIGVMLSPNYIETQRLQTKNVVEASKIAYSVLYDTTKQTLDGLLSLISQLLMGKGTPPGQSVSGPIGLIKAGSEVVSTKDITAVVMFSAAISINLGVVNALPLPALDGGQLAFVLAEALTGRKINQRLQENITGLAVLFLLFVAVTTTFGDVGAILAGR